MRASLFSFPVKFFAFAAPARSGTPRHERERFVREMSPPPTPPVVVALPCCGLANRMRVVVGAILLARQFQEPRSALPFLSSFGVQPRSVARVSQTSLTSQPRPCFAAMSLRAGASGDHQRHSSVLFRASREGGTNHVPVRAVVDAREQHPIV